MLWFCSHGQLQLFSLTPSPAQYIENRKFIQGTNHILHTVFGYEFSALLFLFVDCLTNKSESIPSEFRIEIVNLYVRNVNLYMVQSIKIDLFDWMNKSID